MPGFDISRESLHSRTAAALISALNAELSGRYPEAGATHFRLDADEVTAGRGGFFVARSADPAGRPVGCGAVRLLDEATAELKRMYVVPEARGTGAAGTILDALLAEAGRLGASRMVLETGLRQPEALSLYLRAGFVRVAPFGEYLGSPLSVCMARPLPDAADSRTLGTQRLILSPLVADDAEPLYAYRSHAEVQRYQYFEPASLDDARAFIAAGDAEQPEWRQWGIRMRETAELAGDIGFKLERGETRTAEMGITIAPGFQHRGLAAEAATALVDHLFGQVGARRVVASIDPRNTASISLFERLGFLKEAHFRKSLWFKGEWADDVIYAKLEDI